MLDRDKQINEQAVSELSRILQDFENLLYIMDQILCLDLSDIMKSGDIHWNHYFFIFTSVNLCGYYLDSANGQLKDISDGQTDMEDVFFWITKIRKIFDIISDALEVYMFSDAIGEIVNISHNYLNQIDHIKKQL